MWFTAIPSKPLCDGKSWLKFIWVTHQKESNMTHLMAHCAHVLHSVPERLTDLFILLFNKSLKVERLTTTHFSLDTLPTSDWPLLSYYSLPLPLSVSLIKTLTPDPIRSKKGRVYAECSYWKNSEWVKITSARVYFFNCLIGFATWVDLITAVIIAGIQEWKLADEAAAVSSFRHIWGQSVLWNEHSCLKKKKWDDWEWWVEQTGEKEG